MRFYEIPAFSPTPLLNLFFLSLSLTLFRPSFVSVSSLKPFFFFLCPLSPQFCYLSLSSNHLLSSSISLSPIISTMMQVYCWRCQNNFQLPFGAASIHCTICHAILDPRELLPSNGNRHDYRNEAAPPNGYCQDNRYVYAYRPSGYDDRNRYRSAPALPPHSYGSGYADDNCDVSVPPAAPPSGSGYGFAPPLNGSGYGFAPSPSTNTAVSHLPSPCPPPGGPPPSPHGRKKAVICGISYKSSKYELEGSIPDAKLMKDLLISKFRYPEASIIMLTGTEKDFHFLF